MLFECCNNISITYFEMIVNNLSGAVEKQRTVPRESTVLIKTGCIRYTFLGICRSLQYNER